jgi:hypothetical protein
MLHVLLLKCVAALTTVTAATSTVLLQHLQQPVVGSWSRSGQPETRFAEAPEQAVSAGMCCIAQLSSSTQ